MLVQERRPITPAHLERARVPRRFWNVKMTEVSGSVRSDVVSYFLDVVSHCRAGRGMLLFGANGRGKTSIAVLVAQEVMRHGGTVLFITAEELRQSYLGDVMFEGRASMADRAATVDLLVIDDLGKEYRGASQWAERVIESVLRARSSATKATILTTNMERDVMLGVYSVSVMSILDESMVTVDVGGLSLRRPASLYQNQPACQE